MGHTTKVLSAMLAIVLIAGVLCTTALAATNATSVYIGPAKINTTRLGTSYEWTSYCYLTYTANTSTYIDITEMRQRITNQGEGKVTFTKFTANSGNENNSLSIPHYSDGIPDNGIAAGKTATVTADWDYLCDVNGKSNRYQKNGASNNAFTSMIANSGNSMTTWANTFWLASTRETDLSE